MSNTENISPGLAIEKSIDIHASASKVWDILINPEMISQYFTGAETITSWAIGTEIVFIHIYEGREFTNKGIILAFDPMHLLSYTYWTAFSNTEDRPENYTIITYKLTSIDNRINLSLKQTNFKSLKWYEGLNTGWNSVLTKIKELAEG